MPSDSRAIAADRRGTAWVIDRAAQALIFLGGVSAIVFIVGIFVFITREGAGFIADRLDPVEFFTSPRWIPTSSHRPTYGALALIAGTASVTGLAMLVAVPLSLGAAVYIAEFASGRTREVLKVAGRAAGRHPVGGVGVHRPDGGEPSDHRDLRRADRAQRPQRRRHPRA